MMLTYRLVRLIEDNSEVLSTTLLEKVHTSPLLPDYRNVPADDLRDCVRGIYSHLGEWLLTRKEADISRRYTEIGARRADQGVALSQLAWTIVLTKENLWDFLKRKVVEDLLGVWGELEMLQLLDQFFDRAIYFAALGHEKYHAAQSEAGLPHAVNQ